MAQQGDQYPPTLTYSVSGLVTPGSVALARGGLLVSAQRWEPGDPRATHPAARDPEATQQN